MNPCCECLWEAMERLRSIWDFILSKYADTFKRFGGRTQAADFAGYLLRYNVRILKVPGAGFNRELA